MRLNILTFNVNGIRSLLKYFQSHGNTLSKSSGFDTINSLPDEPAKQDGNNSRPSSSNSLVTLGNSTRRVKSPYAQLLDYFHADIICFQEVKYTGQGNDGASRKRNDPQAYRKVLLSANPADGTTMTEVDHTLVKFGESDDVTASQQDEDDVSGFREDVSTDDNQSNLLLVESVVAKKIPKPLSLSRDLAHIDGYHAFYSLPRFKKGYSGCATFVRHSTAPDSSACKDQVVIPVAAEDGLLSVLRDSEDGITPVFPSDQCRFSSLEMQCLDTEGRCVMTDHGAFVLLNVYVPLGSDEERAVFKRCFCEALELRCNSLVEAGREVIVVGDLNVSHCTIDHCDPVRYVRENGGTPFDDTTSRKWMSRFLSVNGGQFIDVFRHFHPGEKDHFTCWNTKLDARISNYGTRLDYVLCTRGLLPYIKSCEILKDWHGSDHAPVVVEFEIPESDGIQTEKPVSYLPSMCARNHCLDTKVQPTLSSFFTRPQTEINSARLCRDGGSVAANSGNSLRERSPKKNTPSPVKRKPVNSAPIEGGPSRKKAKLSTAKSTKSVLAFFRKESPEVSATSAIIPDDRNQDGVDEASVEESVFDLRNVKVEAPLAPTGPPSRLAPLFSGHKNKTKPPPRCGRHNVPCVSFVTKQGPNTGKRFWRCSLPLKPEGDRTGRCKHFVWE